MHADYDDGEAIVRLQEKVEGLEREAAEHKRALRDLHAGIGELRVWQARILAVCSTISALMGFAMWAIGTFWK